MDENEKLCALAQVAADEMNTVIAYMRMPKSESNVATYNEIIGDAFAPRNPFALEIDFVREPPRFEVNDHHWAATWLLDPRSPKVEMPEQLRGRIAQMRQDVGEAR